MSSFNLTLNSSNAVGNSSNLSFTYNFPQGGITIPEDSTISLSQATIPYSFRNVSNSYGNTTFQYTIPTGSSGNATYTVNLAEGFYTVNDLNNALHTQMYTNGHYWYNTTSPQYNQTVIYPLSLSVNSILYTNSITAITIPIVSNITSVFGASYAQSPTWTGTYPTVSNTCGQIVITGTVSNTTKAIGNLLGFTVGSYPAVYTGVAAIQTVSNGNSLNSSYLSFAPQGSFINGIIIRCNLCRNSASFPNDILTTIPINSTYGSNINFINPNPNNNVVCSSGKYNSITFNFTDQNNNPITVLDPNILMTVNITFPKK